MFDYTTSVKLPAEPKKELPPYVTLWDAPAGIMFRAGWGSPGNTTYHIKLEKYNEKDTIVKVLQFIEDEILTGYYQIDVSKDVKLYNFTPMDIEILEQKS